MNKTTIDNEGDVREGVCPRCGGDVVWAFADPERTVVEVRCPDCGRYVIPKAEFDLAVTDIAVPDETP